MTLIKKASKGDKDTKDKRPVEIESNRFAFVRVYICVHMRINERYDKRNVYTNSHIFPYTHKYKTKTNTVKAERTNRGINKY